MPIRDSAFLPQISALLIRDFLTAFLVGATLTFIMHSAVASVLMMITMVSLGLAFNGRVVVNAGC